MLQARGVDQSTVAKCLPVGSLSLRGGGKDARQYMSTLTFLVQL